MRCIYKMVI